MLCKNTSIVNPRYRVFKPHYKDFNIPTIQCISYSRACIYQKIECSLALEILERDNKSESEPIRILLYPFEFPRE